MVQREVRVAAYHFWHGFDVEHLNARFPCLAGKTRLIADQDRPDLVIFSSFTDGALLTTMPRPPDRGVPRLFLTGENVAPDMAGCDFAISFRRDIDSSRHMRIPNWVQRMAFFGMSPKALLSSERVLGPPGERFCAFVYGNPVPEREALFRALAARGPVDSPGRSMNTMPAIGGSPADKHRFLQQRRFTVAAENSVSPGYTTEKLPDALLAGSLPLYAGDPLVGLDFNPDAFLNTADYPSLEAFADAVMALEADPAAWRRRRDQPAYLNDQLPDCADDARIFAFWEEVLKTTMSGSSKQRSSLQAVRANVAAAPPAPAPAAPVADTSSIGFHGDRHLAAVMKKALDTATYFVETGANRGITLAYTASLYPDLPVWSCESYDVFRAEALKRCEPYPKARISPLPSPQSLVALLAEAPAGLDQRPVFWLDAHAEGVALPLGQELALLTGTFARGHLFIDDFQVPERPWFGFDSYVDGVIGLPYLMTYIARDKAYTLTLPVYQERTSTHHPLRGWCCLSWGQPFDLPAHDGLYEQSRIPALTAPPTPEPIEELFVRAAAVKAGCIVNSGTRDLATVSALLRGAASGGRAAVYAVSAGDDETADTAFRRAVAMDEAFSALRLVDLPPADAATGWTQPIGLLHVAGSGDFWALRRDVLRWLPHVAEGGGVILSGDSPAVADVAAEIGKISYVTPEPGPADAACFKIGPRPSAKPLRLHQVKIPAAGSPLLRQARNVTSQYGEDGVIAAVFERIGIRSRWCVEFGAWDGRHLSNTYDLLAHQQWSGVPIEGDPVRFLDLLKTYGDNRAVYPLNAYVANDGEKVLDRLLASTPIPKDFDLLSIDIDGNDWHVWRSLRVYRPRVVVIEFNPTIPNDVVFVQAAEPSLNHGCSLRALVELGREKGYRLAAVTSSNGIFVTEQDFAVLGVDDSDLDTLYTPATDGRVFHGYDGTVFTVGMGSFLWHPDGRTVAPEDAQVLPPEERVFPHPGWRRPR